MKNADKTDAKRPLKAVSFTLSQGNIDKIEQSAQAETRGNRSLWLDQKLTTLFAGDQDGKHT